MPEVTLLFLLGTSYPADQRIEDALAERLPHRHLRYAEFLRRYQGGTHLGGLDVRVETLRHALSERDPRSTIIIGRSSGAIAATRVAAEHVPDLLGIVALGYPFRHPEREHEPYRVDHLSGLATPTLIFQGLLDIYGGPDAAERYPLAPAIAIEGVPGSHEFNLPPEGWADMAERVRLFIDALSRSPRRLHRPAGRRRAAAAGGA